MKLARSGRAWGLGGLASLALILEVGFGLRVAAADVVEWAARRQGSLCLFDDTAIYVGLARAIGRGATFEVGQYGIPHFALRTPGYPLFLAACRWAFGGGMLPVRLVQAGLNTLMIWWAYRLVGRLDPEQAPGSGWTAPLIASALVAVEPFIVGSSALILSEGVFIPLMVLALWSMAVLWRGAGEGPRQTPGRRGLIAFGTGIVAGLASLVRPSWALFVPAMLLAWVVAPGKGNRPESLRGAALVALGVAAAMAPWWGRNFEVYGRFVPTALWVGASLHDGLNPGADGSSDMRFLEAPDLVVLDEEEQDAELRRRSWAFVRAEPGRTAGLAVVKAARYWSPWPNAGEYRSSWAAIASASVVLPVYLGLVAGAWDRKRDVRALVLLGGPIVYFCILHMIFASSIRYRVPGSVPAMGLAAIGFRRLARARSGP